MSSTIQRQGCVCGAPRKKPLTKKEIRLFTKLRGRPIVLCPLCMHEVHAPRTAHDVRRLAAIGDRLAHRECIASDKNKP